MTNKQKLNQTVISLKAIREKYEKSLEEQKNAAKDIKSQKEAVEKMMILAEFEFPKMKPYATFFSETYGYHTQLICNRKKRVQAVPLCFLVTLYEQDLKAAFPREEIQIPYTLRGFWKMEKAVQFLEDFVSFQNKSQNILLWQYRILECQRRVKAMEYLKILEEFVSMCTVSSKWQKKISYHDSDFIMNTKNVKLDVVPLCKLLTIYYVRVIREMEHYQKAYASRPEKEGLETIKSDFSKLMEKYFTVKTIC